MRFSSLIGSVLSVASAVQAFSDDLSQAESLKIESAPGRFIVEYEDQKKPASPQNLVSPLGLDIDVQLEYDSNIFKGSSFKVHNSNDATLDELKSLAGVKNAWQASIVTLVFDPETIAESAWDTHKMTGVDQLHERGEFGDDIVVAVVDSGFDVNHEVFSHGVFDHGYDFSTDPNNPTNDVTDCNGHGTFVSSVIAANSKSMLGVAPGAKIRMYKVFGCEGTTSDDIILAALLKAYEEKPDVISLSLGSDRGYNTHPVSAVGSKIAETIPVVFAAGNSGESGPYTASSGASGNNVMAVGSVSADDLVTWPALLTASDGTTRWFNYVSNTGSIFRVNGTYDIDVIPNICFVDQTAPNKQTIIMGGRGLCADQYMPNYLHSSGYATAIAFTNDLHYMRTEIVPWSDLQNLGLANTDVRDWINEKNDAGYKVKISFNTDSTPKETDDPRSAAGFSSYYTSWGPTFENNFYPHFSAPGGFVLGASAGGGYVVERGTSFACPYIAGVAALYLKARLGTSPSELRTRMIASSHLLPQFQLVSEAEDDLSNSDPSIPAPLIQQGAGLIDAVVLFDQKTRVLSNPYLELNDTDNRVATHKISFVNENSESVTYKIAHTAHKAVNSRQKDVHVLTSYYPPLVDVKATADISQEEITLGPQESAEFEVTINVPDVDDDEAPVIQGTIDISGSNGDSIRVPYMGVIASTYNWTPFYDSVFFYRVDSSDGINYGLEKEPDYPFTPHTYDSPKTYFVPRYGTEFYSFDLVSEDYDVDSYVHPPKADEKGFYGPLMLVPGLSGTNDTFPIQYSGTANNYASFTFQAYANGSAIESGTYRVLGRALRMFGVRENFEDWQFFLSLPFKVVGQNGPISEKPSASESASESSAAESSDVFSSAESSAVESSIAESSAAESSAAESSAAESSAAESSAVESSVAQSSAVESSAAESSAAESSAAESSAAESSAGASSDIETASTSDSVSSTVETGSISASASSDASVSTASSASNTAVPTGADIISNIELYDSVSKRADRVNRDHLLTIAVTLQSEESITQGTKTQFTIPGIFYDFLSPFDIQTTDGVTVGTVTGDESTNVFTVEITSDWAETHRDIEGTFTFNVRLSYTLANLSKRALDTLVLSGATSVPITFTTPTREFTTVLVISNDAAEPVETVPEGETRVISGTEASGSISGSVSVSTRTNTDVETVTSCSECTGVSTSGNNQVTSTRKQTTVVTVTSCSDNKCSTKESTALVSTATTTVNGKETVYTTYCPIEETITVTVTSCDSNGCKAIKSPAILSTATATINGAETVYTTYCPITEAGVKTQNVNSGKEVTKTRGAQVSTPDLASASPLVIQTGVTISPVKSFSGSKPTGTAPAPVVTVPGGESPAGQQPKASTISPQGTLSSGFSSIQAATVRTIEGNSGAVSVSRNVFYFIASFLAVLA